MSLEQQKRGKEPVSACCEAPIRVAGGREGTNYYVCTACGKPCDPQAGAEEKLASD